MGVTADGSLLPGAVGVVLGSTGRALVVPYLPPPPPQHNPSLEGHRAALGPSALRPREEGSSD